MIVLPTFLPGIPPPPLRKKQQVQSMQSVRVIPVEVVGGVMNITTYLG